MMSRAESVVPARAELGEGPVWDSRSETLFWVDILAGRVHRFWPDQGVDVSRGVGGLVTALGIREGGGLVVALADRIGLVDADEVNRGLAAPDRPTGNGASRSGENLRVAQLTPTILDTGTVRFNDATVDPTGRLLAGSMDWQGARPTGALYQIAGDGTVRQLLDQVTVSNGIDVTDDGGTLYHVDSATGGVSAFQRDTETGELRSPRRIIDVPASEGVPDGLTLDAEGCLWVAIWGAGEVRRYAADGRPIGIIDVPTPQVSSVAFGGRLLDKMFITTARTGLGDGELARSPSAGNLFWCVSGATGRSSPRFAG